MNIIYKTRTEELCELNLKESDVLIPNDNDKIFLLEKEYKVIEKIFKIKGEYYFGSKKYIYSDLIITLEEIS